MAWKPPSQGSSDHTTAINARAQQGRVLLVDDNPLLCEGFSRLLRYARLECLTANSAERAFELIEGTAFDLLVTDVMMPGMSGVELVERLEHSKPDLKCLVITGHASKEMITRLAAVDNVIDVLTKPVDTRRLIQRIQAVINRRSEQPTTTAGGRRGEASL